MRVRAILLVTALAACGPPAPSAAEVEGLFYPRHEAPYGEGDMAGLDGTLEFRDGCLLIDSGDGSSLLPIWPRDTMPGVINNLPVILTVERVLVTETGEQRLFGGSQVDEARATELAGPIPEPCTADGYWIVTRVDRAP
jgi:hypothetical protein